jgi:predicted metal-dependent phosphoesterase TrpH
MNSYKVDLHMHTNYSDGNLNPFQLIVKAKEAGLKVISITDHDNVNALHEAIRFGKEMGVIVIPGVEISADLDGQEIHILGYFIDYENSDLKDYLVTLRAERLKRVEKMCIKLNELGSHIKAETLIVEDENEISIGRPHVAAALSQEGFVGSYYEAFIKYIGDGKPAYIKKPNPTYIEVISLISGLGGLSFIAHPGKIVREELLFKLINAGIDGIEVIHPAHSKEDIQYFSEIASEHFLLTSGGSDFHGGLKNDQKNFGNFCISDKEIINMKRRLFK